jgi:hypothetical protein
MIEYKLIVGTNPDMLSAIITNYISDGWVLYGFPYTVVSGGTWMHYQAMTR